jgi:hypothetical protein
MQYNTHVLANGAKLVTLSPHSFKFSDGTESPPQDKDFCNKFTLKKNFSVARQIKGMNVTKTFFVVSSEQYDCLNEIAKSVDIILVPFQFLQALHDTFGPNGAFDNVVAFNATVDTARSSPNEKIVDINNWSSID